MLMLLMIGTVFILWLWSRRNRRKDEPPLYSGSKILFGHALQYALNSEKLWNTLLRISEEALERGGVLKTTIGPRTLYNQSNLVRWGKATAKSCNVCGEAGGMAKHLLIWCRVLLEKGQYSRRHDKVLEIHEAVSLSVARAQKGITITKRSIEFVKEGSSKKTKQKPHSIMDAVRDWTIMMDTYEKQYRIPEDNVVSSSRPDKFLYFRQLKRVILVELTVPWETNITKDHTFKDLGKMLMLLMIGTVFILWLWSRRNRRKDEPPLYSGSKILIGHALQYAGNSEKLWNTLLRISEEALERGGVLKTTIGPRTLYMLTDPEDFLKATHTCLHKDAVYSFTRPWVGDGLTTSKPPLWKVHRRLLNPAFSQHVLDSFMDVFNSQSRCLVQNVKTQIGKGPFDHWEYTKTNAFETICLTALGVDFKEKTEENLEFVMASAEIFKILVSRFQKFWLHNNLLFNLSSLRRRQDKCIRILHRMSDKILKQRKEYLVNNISSEDNEEGNTKGTRFKPFMELLLELSRDSDVFTDLVIREQVDTFIVAGLDTTANAVMFCMLMIGSYPQVQEKIYEELKNIFGKDDRDVTKKDLSQLVYLEAVIKESMRIYPTVPVIGRYLEEDIKLRNCTLYKGNSVFMIIHGVYRHSMWGPDVKEFRPERWLDASTLPDYPNPFVGFSLGRRNCIGKTYAMMSMKITLAHFFRNYIVHGDHTKIKLKMEVFLTPVSGHHISIETRNS